MKTRKKIIFLCECGCGEIPVNRFINGHNRRGILLSNKTKQKLRAANLGKKLSKETRKKISFAQTGENNAMKRPEVKAKHLEVMRSKEYRENMSKIMKGKTLGRKNLKGSIALKKFYKNLSLEEKEKLSIKRKIFYKNLYLNESLEENKIRRKKYSHIVTEKTRKKISKKSKQLWQDKEYRNKQMDSQITKKDNQSVAAIQRIKNNPRTAGGYGKSGFYYSKKNKKEIHYRSSYELIAYKILEQLSKVASYDNEPFSIKYNCFGIIHRTLPDILVTYTDGARELIEVKPEWKLNDKVTILKFMAMENYCKDNNMNFSIWSESKLGI